MAELGGGSPCLPFFGKTTHLPTACFFGLAVCLLYVSRLDQYHFNGTALAVRGKDRIMVLTVSMCYVCTTNYLIGAAGDEALPSSASPSPILNRGASKGTHAYMCTSIARKVSLARESQFGSRHQIQSQFASFFVLQPSSTPREEHLGRTFVQHSYKSPFHPRCSLLTSPTTHCCRVSFFAPLAAEFLKDLL